MSGRGSRLDRWREPSGSSAGTGVTWAIPAATFAATLILYLFTMAPTIYNLDSAEFTTASYTGGLVRATGYPLYLIIGRFWSHIPIGDPGFRMNLLSAVCGALTIALAVRILQRFGVQNWALIGALGLLATAQYFWAMSLVAEVYTLHTAMIALVILALLRWADRPSARNLAAATFLVGLGFGNHVSTVLAAPACLWFVLTKAPRQALQMRTLMMAAASLLAGLTVYLYLPLVQWTQPVFNYAGWYNAAGSFEPLDLGTFDGLWWLVSGKSFAGVMMGYTPSELVREVGHFGAEVVRAFMALGIGPGLLGLVVVWRRDRSLGGMLVLLFAVNAAFYINYRVVDKNTMFLPAYLVWALWIGFGYQWLLDWVGRRTEAKNARFVTGATRSLQFMMVAAVFFAMIWNWPLVDLSDDRSARLRAERILESVPPDSLIIGWWDTVPLVEYMQLVEGRRQDIKALNRFLIRVDDLRELVMREMDRRPVYFDQPPGALLPSVEVVREGSLFRLFPKGATVTEDPFGSDRSPTTPNE